MTELFKKRLWTVSDFAEFMQIPYRQALALLKSLDAELNGMLLRKSGSKKPEYSFFPSLLAKAKPEIFETLVPLEARVERLEEAHDEARSDLQRVVFQVSQNSRDIVAIRSKMSAA